MGIRDSFHLYHKRKKSQQLGSKLRMRPGKILKDVYKRQPLAPFLEAQGFRVQQPPGLNRLDARHLSGVGLVIICLLYTSRCV